MREDLVIRLHSERITFDYNGTFTLLLVEGSCFHESEIYWLLFQKACRVKGLMYLEFRYDNVLARSFA